MIREDLVAERIAIDSYRDFIRYLGEHDPTTRRMLEGILAVEEKHADELSDLLVSFPEESSAMPRSRHVAVSALTGRATQPPSHRGP